MDWKDGSVLSPAQDEFHQHFNTGREPARYLAVLLGQLHRGPGSRSPYQIDYEDQDPSVYDLYVAECAKHGVDVVLPRPEYRRA